jgi:hypothetical protein
MNETKFQYGDRVERDERNLSWPYSGQVLTGIVTRVYGRIKTDLLGQYPEVYDVLWDNGKESRGYLPHGISKEK